MYVYIYIKLNILYIYIYVYIEMKHEFSRWARTKTMTSKCHKLRNSSHAAILFFRNFSCLSCLLLLEPLPQRLFRNRHFVSLANSDMSRVNICNRLLLPVAQLDQYLFHVYAYVYIHIHVYICIYLLSDELRHLCGASISSVLHIAESGGDRQSSISHLLLGLEDACPQVLHLYSDCWSIF